VRFAYDPATGNLQTLTAPDGGTVSYGYDARDLPTSLTWAGTITGTVHQTYTAQAQLASQQVNSAPSIAFTYDPSGDLVQAGALRLFPDSPSGRHTGAALGTTNDAWTYTGFGEPESYTSSASGTPLLRS